MTDAVLDGRLLQHPDDDPEIQRVLKQIMVRDLAAGFTEAIRTSIDYVLDSPRTLRFDHILPGGPSRGAGLRRREAGV